MISYQTFRNLIFKCDAENAHRYAEKFLSHIANKPLVQDFLLRQFHDSHSMLQNTVCGLIFDNPIGLAAGFDKNASMLEGLSALGFGFLELGTITQRPQEGNPRPRLFRHVEEKSIQNAMGFNNDGAQKIKNRLQRSFPFCIPLGINLGKNKHIEQKDALRDYEAVLKEFLDLGDYYVFNLSSPNTPNLRDLQNESFVSELFAMARSLTRKPLFLKISPDMDTDSMLAVCQRAIDHQASGIIATNTTIDYSLVCHPKEIGGISGQALKEKSAEVFKVLAEHFFKKTILISVGGISDAKEAYKRIRQGASLVQILTGLIYEGPGICKSINGGLVQFLKQDGFEHINEAIGVDL
ncbi:dihydroorotate dehydrogenase [Helicobacter mustelae]|nr:quinone-dependent dihydroorotate dehydrogenase [Helicobacter mustelae]STP13300.1 dihydroorotate dehydrogenase [Helicobacter mustelae]